MSDQDSTVTFVQFHKPALLPGQYRFAVTQTMPLGQEKFNAPTLDLLVEGERFSLNPASVYHVFPPNGRMGHYTNVLPHIVLNRSTLPWERLADDKDPDQTWLALLLFDEGELARGDVSKPKNLSFEAFKKNTAYQCDGGLSDQQHDDISVIQVNANLLKKIMPSAEDLKRLCHVRHFSDPRSTQKSQGQTKQDQNNQEQTSNELERAVVMCNRLPKEGCNSILHLVSVEGLFDQAGLNIDLFEADKPIQLVSLKSWHFSCPAQFKVTDESLQAFKGPQSADDVSLRAALKQLYATGHIYPTKKAFIQAINSQLETPLKPAIADDCCDLSHYRHSFEDQLKAINSRVIGLDGTDESPAHIKPFLDTGYLPLPHQLRWGQHTYSWYRGPLAASFDPARFVSGVQGAEEELPKYADSLLRYYQNSGMLDVSYAAAYEIGRTLALADPLFSQTLYQYKHAYNMQLIKNLQQVQLDRIHISSQTAEGSKSGLKEKITKWFEDLALLRTVPFNYLIADEKLLPNESLRFFQLDQHWIECLIFGAFSIGGDIRENQQRDCFIELAGKVIKQQCSGLILRSELVSDHPDLHVQAFPFAKADSSPLNECELSQKLKCVRFDRLADDTLFCLFDSKVATAEFYLKPVGLHFGFQEREQRFFKSIRTEDVVNSILNHQPQSLAAAKRTQIIAKVINANVTSQLFTDSNIKSAELDGGKIEFPVDVGVKDAGLRLLDIDSLLDKFDMVFKGVTDYIKDGNHSDFVQPEFTAAQLGLYMLEGSNKGRFSVSGVVND